MARLLWCLKCQKEAIAPANQAFPKGEPIIVGRHQPSFKCARCKHLIKVSPTDWARLPSVNQQQLADLAKRYAAPQLTKLLG